MQVGRLTRQAGPGFTPRRAHAKAAPGVVPSRTPPLQLLSPYGPALHGHQRGPLAFIAEPLNAWLTLLAEAVPFYRDCLIVCPSSMPESQVRTLWTRARAHMPTAHVAVMEDRYRAPRSSTPQEPPPPLLSPTLTAPVSAGEQGTAGTLPAVHPKALQTTSSLAPSSVVHSTTAATAPTPASPLRSLHPASFDVIVLAGNVFADDMFYDAPWHVSLAHRALRPHGVLGIFGYDREVDVSAPEWAAEDLRDFYEVMHEEVEDTLSELRSAEASPPYSTTEGGPRAQRRLERARKRAHFAQELERAREVMQSSRIAHVDTYFPFSAVQRRWFVSEYAMNPADVSACVRAVRPLQLLHQLEGQRDALGLRRPYSAVSTSPPSAPAAQPEPQGSALVPPGPLVPPTDSGEEPLSTQPNRRDGNADGGPSSSSSRTAQDDFVDTLQDDLAACLPPDAAADLDEDVALNVVRRRHAVDPLEALEECWSARLALDSYAPRRAGRAKSVTPPLRVRVRHFVITCSNRSMNAPVELGPHHTPSGAFRKQRQLPHGGRGRGVRPTARGQGEQE